MKAPVGMAGAAVVFLVLVAQAFGTDAIEPEMSRDTVVAKAATLARGADLRPVGAVERARTERPLPHGWEGAGRVRAGETDTTRGAVPEVPADTLTVVVRRLCGACHNDQLLTGNLSLQHFDVAKAPERAETAEKMIRKLRAGMMPPPGIPRPGGDTLVALVETLERLIDDAAADRKSVV